MIRGLLILLLCQFSGELIAYSAHIPVPGSVIGMLLLFVALVLRRGVPKGLEQMSQALLKPLTLYFIPASVGIMTMGPLLKEEGLRIGLVMLLSTLLPLLICGYGLDHWLARRGSPMSALLSSPVPWLLLTLIAYELGNWLFKQLKEPVWAPPLLIALVLIMSSLILTGSNYQSYFKGNALLHFMLGPATVALVVPLYHALPRLVATAKPLLATLLVGTLLGGATAMAIATALGLSHATVLAFATRAVTTPIAIGIAAHIGAPIALAAAIVGFSGVLGAALAEPLLRGVKSDIARGFALGLAAHGVGTARAFQLHPTAGAFAALGMGLNGILTAFWLPPLIHALG